MAAMEKKVNYGRVASEDAIEANVHCFSDSSRHSDVTRWKFQMIAIRTHIFQQFAGIGLRKFSRFFRIPESAVTLTAGVSTLLKFCKIENSDTTVDI